MNASGPLGVCFTEDKRTAAECKRVSSRTENVLRRACCWSFDKRHQHETAGKFLPQKYHLTNKIKDVSWKFVNFTIYLIDLYIYIHVYVLCILYFCFEVLYSPLANVLFVVFFFPSIVLFYYFNVVFLITYWYCSLNKKRKRVQNLL